MEQRPETPGALGITRVLIVVAHPDDEVLGCGGTASVLSSHGAVVRSCILCSKVEVRANRPEADALERHMLDAQTLLGLEPPICGFFPNIAFNTIPHVDLVRFIEEAIEETGAGVVFTHHPSDVNDDHRQTSYACQAAVRLFQRRQGGPRLVGLHFMEVLSSTEWSLGNPADRFAPNSFFEIGEAHLDRKLAALAAYEGVMRAYPHPRSREAVRALAQFRGAQAGMDHAEAFQTAYADLGATLRLPSCTGTL